MHTRKGAALPYSRCAASLPRHSYTNALDGDITGEVYYRAVIGGSGQFKGATGVYWHTSTQGEQASVEVWVPSLPTII